MRKGMGGARGLLPVNTAPLIRPLSAIEIAEKIAAMEATVAALQEDVKVLEELHGPELRQRARLKIVDEMMSGLRKPR